MNGSRSKWLSVLAGVSLFALGAVAGITFDRLHVRHSTGSSVDMGQVQQDPIGAIDKMFPLRPEQRTQIQAIIDRRQAGLDSAWGDARNHVRAMADSLVLEVAAVLEPGQRARFIELARELHRSGHVNLPRH